MLRSGFVANIHALEISFEESLEMYVWLCDTDLSPGRLV
jgi:hypothetical protein